MKKSVLFVLVSALTSVCFGQWLERQVVLGDTFGGIYALGELVVNPISGNVYVESDPVQIFDPMANQKLSSPGDSGLVVFCPPSGNGYIFGTAAAILDAAADTVIGRRALPFRPSMLAYSRTSNRLYLASPAESAELVVFDPSGDSVLEIIDVGYVVTSVLWDSSPNRLYVGTRSDSGVIRVLDCTGDSLVGDVRVGLEEVWVLALSTASRKLYCADSSEDVVVKVVSTDSLTFIDSVNDVWQPPTMVYSPVTDRLYCPNEEGYGLNVVDCRTDTLRSEVNVDVASLAPCTPDGRVFIGQNSSGPVLVLDTNDVVVDTIEMPDAYINYVGALVFQPERNVVYGAMTGDYAFVIDATGDSVAGLFNYTSYRPRQMIHNPAGNKLYLFDPDHDDVLVLDSTFVTLKHIPGGISRNYAVPILDRALNRIYVADRSVVRVIDCNSDSLIGTHYTYSNRPVPVLVPYLSKLYVLDDNTRGGYVQIYDCLRDTVTASFYFSDRVYGATYDPRSNRVFFAGGGATLSALDPLTDSVVKRFYLGIPARLGRITLNPDLGRLYCADQGTDLMSTIDVLTDSVIASDSLPWDIDSIILNRRLGKLYLCARDSARILVYDCAQGAIADTIRADYHYAAAMNDLNDKLYLRYGAVLDCRYDSVVAMLPPGSQDPRCMAWDAIDNRVFQVSANWLYVYRDGPYGIADRSAELREQRHATIVRGVLFLPSSPRTANSSLLSIDGRKVLDLQPGANDVRGLPAGVYFVRQAAGSRTTKVVIQR